MKVTVSSGTNERTMGTPMPPTPSPEERRLAFEARRLAAETLAKVYLEHTQGARQLVMAHLRQMFTLSVGAIAGTIALYGTLLRFGSETTLRAITCCEIALGIPGLAALISSALIAFSINGNFHTFPNYDLWQLGGWHGI